tara:strand:+ start:454 stop:903 length:450 start_codon:yes stop_codon:yes gene_type:complete
MKQILFTLLLSLTAFKLEAKPINKVECVTNFANKNTTLIDNNVTTLSNNVTILSNNNVTCTLCKVLVDTIEAEVKHGNHTIMEITNILKEICSAVSGPSGKTCVLVIQNIQNIVNWVSQGLSNIQVCEKLHLCHNSTIVNSVSNKNRIS